jgi:hypothetical protein
VTNIEQEVGRTEGTRQLWETVDEIDDELSGATRDYVNQD